MTRRNPWGTLSLIAAAVGFAFFEIQPWWPPASIRFPRAFFEASLVGALADWFAVTALFRRPLGLPLPHTDILFRRKDQLVAALPRFVATFLEPESLDPQLRAVDWAGLLLDRLEPTALDELFDGAVDALADSPARLQWEQTILTVGAGFLHRELSLHRDAMVGPITELIKRNAGWKGLFVSRDTVDEAVEGFLEELLRVKERPDHELRRTLGAAVHDAWPRWASQAKPSLWTVGTWKRLETDEGFRRNFNHRAGDLAVALWEKASVTAALTTSLGYLLAQTDARSLTRRVEAAVGHDLQFVRVNGALVGGLVGVFLELFRG